MAIPARRSLLAALLLTLAALATVVGPTADSAAATTTHARLAAELRRAIQHNGAAHLDYFVHVAHVGDFSHGGTRQSAPASNEKLLTAMTLLRLVGPKFHYATTVAATSDVVDHTVIGDLVVRGSGDPTLTGYDLLAMAKRLHRMGLRHVTGHLIVDDTRYSHQTRVSGWKHEFVPNQTGPVSAFTVDHNAWRGGAAFDQDPTIYNARRFRTALKKKHISIERKIEVRRAPRTVTTLLTHHSPNLAAITHATLTDSINFDAEMMLREAGAQRTGYGSPKTGAAAIKATATVLDLPLGVAHDGSGLSYTDRESPAILVSWLRALRGLPFFTTVYDALPLSCETGTLEHRLCGPNVRGRVRAKTGTLTHVSALSGYVTSESGDVVTFSFLADGVHNFGRLYARVDKAVALLRREG